MKFLVSLFIITVSLSIFTGHLAPHPTFMNNWSFLVKVPFDLFYGGILLSLILFIGITLCLTFISIFMGIHQSYRMIKAIGKLILT